MLCIATVNRFALTPRLPVATATRALEKNCLAEIGLGLCVFLLVGALGTLSPPGHTHIPPANIAADAAFVHIHSSEAMADVTVEPGRVGTAHARVLLMNDDFSILTAKGLTFVLTPQVTSQATPDAAAISRAAVRGPDGAWRVDGLDIGQPGTWIVKLLITAGAAEPIVLDAPIVIER
jgi:copper transport protein